jgi:MFS family permease
MPLGLVEIRGSPRQSLQGLDWLNFFLAGILTGFGPFVALYLAGRDWTPVEIGFVLSVSGLTGLLIQVPSGVLLDVVRSKRTFVAIGVATIGCAALIFTLRPSFTPVLMAEVLLGVTGGSVGPAVAAISLGLVGNDRLAERLGRNQRFAAIGGFATAGVMGLLGHLFSSQAIFFVTAALTFPTLIALGQVRAGDVRLVRARGAPGDYPPERHPRTARGTLGTNDRLLVFASCIVLFQLANASVLPLVIEERSHASSLLTSVLVSTPQIVVAILAPWVGRSARSWGRRPLLLVGLGMLPIRAACFALTDDPMLLASVQMFDGISAAVIGVLTPLIIADITKGTGLFNRGQGFVGTFSGTGAALSTTLSGYLAQNFGGTAAFYFIMGVALTAVIVCWSFMSETKDTPQAEVPAGRNVSFSTIAPGAARKTRPSVGLFPT